MYVLIICNIQFEKKNFTYLLRATNIYIRCITIDSMQATDVFDIDGTFFGKFTNKGIEHKQQISNEKHDFEFKQMTELATKLKPSGTN